MPRYAYDHIHLRSRDPMKTAQFYHRMFDARIIETPQPAGPDRVDLDFDGLMVFIAGALPPGEEQDGLRDPHYGLDHFGFRVEDLDDTVRELKSRGAHVMLLHPGTVATQMTKGARGWDSYTKPAEAAAGLAAQLDRLGPETPIEFRHADGTLLPW